MKEGEAAASASATTPEALPTQRPRQRERQDEVGDLCQVMVAATDQTTQSVGKGEGEPSRQTRGVPLFESSRNRAVRKQTTPTARTMAPRRAPASGGRRHLEHRPRRRRRRQRRPPPTSTVGGVDDSRTPAVHRQAAASAAVCFRSSAVGCAAGTHAAGVRARGGGVEGGQAAPGGREGRRRFRGVRQLGDPTGAGGAMTVSFLCPAWRDLLSTCLHCEQIGWSPPTHRRGHHHHFPLARGRRNRHGTVQTRRSRMAVRPSVRTPTDPTAPRRPSQ